VRCHVLTHQRFAVVRNVRDAGQGVENGHSTCSTTNTTRQVRSEYMDDTASSLSGVTVADTLRGGDAGDAVSPKPAFHFLQLPRELRDQVRHHFYVSSANH
jgi:hypothetical protein